MFTHQVVERMSDLVLVRAVIAERAVPFSKRLAKGAVGIQPKAMFSFEEFREAKLICWRRLLGVAEMLKDRRRCPCTTLRGNAHG